MSKRSPFLIPAGSTLPVAFILVFALACLGGVLILAEVAVPQRCLAVRFADPMPRPSRGALQDPVLRKAYEAEVDPLLHARAMPEGRVRVQGRVLPLADYETRLVEHFLGDAMLPREVFLEADPEAKLEDMVALMGCVRAASDRVYDHGNTMDLFGGYAIQMLQMGHAPPRSWAEFEESQASVEFGSCLVLGPSGFPRRSAPNPLDTMLLCMGALGGLAGVAACILQGRRAVNPEFAGWC